MLKQDYWLLCRMAIWHRNYQVLFVSRAQCRMIVMERNSRSSTNSYWAVGPRKRVWYKEEEVEIRRSPFPLKFSPPGVYCLVLAMGIESAPSCTSHFSSNNKGLRYGLAPSIQEQVEKPMQGIHWKVHWRRWLPSWVLKNEEISPGKEKTRRVSLVTEATQTPTKPVRTLKYLQNSGSYVNCKLKIFIWMATEHFTLFSSSWSTQFPLSWLTTTPFWLFRLKNHGFFLNTLFLSLTQLLRKSSSLKCMQNLTPETCAVCSE
jgi:hypothetical protein